MMEWAGNTWGRKGQIAAASCPKCAGQHQSSLSRLKSAQAALTRAIIADQQGEFTACAHALGQCRSTLAQLHGNIMPAQPFADILRAVFANGMQRIDRVLDGIEPGNGTSGESAAITDGDNGAPAGKVAGGQALQSLQRDLDDLLAGFRAN